jgi:hypothetical protein
MRRNLSEETRPSDILDVKDSQSWNGPRANDINSTACSHDETVEREAGPDNMNTSER